MKRIGLSVVGAGVMGHRHAMTIAASQDAAVSLVIDGDLDRAERLAAVVGARGSCDLDDAVATDGAIIATPTACHAATSLPLIEAGLPVMVEKPLAQSIDDVRRMLDASRRGGTVLMCGFIERFNPALADVRRIPITRHSRITTTRFGRPSGRSYGGVVDDLLVHDLDLVLGLVGAASVTHHAIESSEWNHERTHPEAVQVRLDFDIGCTAILRASRIADRRIRSMSVSGGREGGVVVDLLAGAAQDGNGLAAQLGRFIHLVETATEAEREVERAAIMPSHRLVDEIIRGMDALR